MTCPTCGLRQWNYDENTLTCKNGHLISKGKKFWRPAPAKVIGVVAPASFVLGFLIGHL